MWNIEGRFQGYVDVPLDDTGLAQAVRAARLLAALRPGAIVSSDLARAARTAEALGDVAGLPVALDIDLRERSMGSWEGLTRDEVAGGYPEDWAVREPSDGETYGEVANRVVAAVGRGLEKIEPGGTLVVVSHGQSLRLGISHLLGLPRELWRCLGPLANCSWSMLGEGSSGWRLLEHNAGTLPEPVHGDDR